MRHDGGEGRARRPVERVLQYAGNTVVELWRAKDEPVAFGNRGEQRLDGLGAFLALEILVVKRNRSKVVYPQLGATGEFLAQCLEHRVRIGAGAQTAGHPN